MSKKRPVAATPNAEESEAETAVADRSPAAICKHVLAALGRPTDFLRITVRRVTTEDYRVNVVTGPDVTCARIAHSYYITADEAGNVTASSPKIVKQY